MTKYKTLDLPKSVSNTLIY